MSNESNGIDNYNTVDVDSNARRTSSISIVENHEKKIAFDANRTEYCFWDSGDGQENSHK